MNYLQIINFLTLAIPAFIAGTKKVVKGNEKYILAIAVYFLLKRFAEVAATNEAKEKIQSPSGLNANALAQLYRQAMNPSGYGWMMELDGTNENLIFDLAAKTNNFQSVSTSYRALYGTDLTSDLRKELSSDDYTKFVQTLNNLI